MRNNDDEGQRLEEDGLKKSPKNTWIKHHNNEKSWLTDRRQKGKGKFWKLIWKHWKHYAFPLLLVIQLQGLVAELREGLHAAFTELCELRQRDHCLQDKLQAHQTDVDDKIMGLKNSLHTFKVLKTHWVRQNQIQWTYCLYWVNSWSGHCNIILNIWLEPCWSCKLI